MKAKDVKVGGEYMTKVGNVPVKVTGEAIRRASYGAASRDGPMRFYVSRVDNGQQLPKPRTAAALQSVPKTPAEEAGKRLAKEHAAERIFYGNDAIDEIHLRDIIKMRYPGASEETVVKVAAAYRAGGEQWLASSGGARGIRQEPAAMNNLRAVVLGRMTELGLDSRGLATLMAEPWGGIKVESAKARIDRYLADDERHRDMTTAPFWAMLNVLGLTIGVSVDCGTK